MKERKGPPCVRPGQTRSDRQSEEYALVGTSVTVSDADEEKVRADDLAPLAKREIDLAAVRALDSGACKGKGSTQDGVAEDLNGKYYAGRGRFAHPHADEVPAPGQECPNTCST